MGPQEHTRSTSSFPSTSWRYGPLALLMNRGVPPTDRNARTGEFTPPGVTVRARSKAASLRTVAAAGRTVISSAPCVCDRVPRRPIECPVAQDQIRASAPDGGQRLLDRRLPIDPAVGSRGLYHGVLTGDVVCRYRQIDSLADRTYHIEVAERRLDHDNVGTLLDVEGHLAKCLTNVGRILLVCPP